MSQPIDQFSRLSQANVALAMNLAEALMASSERLYDLNRKLLDEFVTEASVATSRTLPRRSKDAAGAGKDALPAHHWEDIVTAGEQWRLATIEGISTAFEQWQQACLDGRPARERDEATPPALCPWPVSSRAGHRA